MFKRGDKVLFLSTKNEYGPDSCPHILHLGVVSEQHKRYKELIQVKLNAVIHAHADSSYLTMGFWINADNLVPATLSNLMVLYVQIPKKYRHHTYNAALFTDLGRAELANNVSGFPTVTKAKINAPAATSTKTKKRTSTKRTTTSTAKSKRNANKRG